MQFSRTTMPALFRSSKYLNRLPRPSQHRPRYMYPVAIFVNCQGQRIDEPIPRASDAEKLAEARELKYQMKHSEPDRAPQPCLNHYLKGPCSSNNCRYGYQKPLTEIQIDELAVRARKLPCPVGAGCRDPGCVRG